MFLLKLIIISLVFLTGCHDLSDSRDSPRLAIIGTGYVGLVSGTCLSQTIPTICVDNNKKRIEGLKSLNLPFYEPGLEDLVKQGVKNKHLFFTTNIQEAVRHANIVMICVGTPSDSITGEADLSYVKEAAHSIAKAMDTHTYTVVVIKSTVPVGTAEKVADIIEKTRPELKRGEHFDMASNPEFLREGCAIEDFLNPHRIVIGVNSERAKKLLTRLYHNFIDRYPVQFVSIASSELSKYASNAFLATKISFANQMSDLCEKIPGTDIEHITKIMGLDPRIGPDFLKVGPGYGGSCFPKDTLALKFMGDQHDVRLSLVDETIKSNEKRKGEMVQKVHSIMTSHKLPASHLAVLGITFKANTDDLREATSLKIIPDLIRKGYQITVYDPMYKAENSYTKPDWSVQWASSLEEALRAKDGVVILTDWDEFYHLRTKDMAKLMKHPIMIDLRNMFSQEEMRHFSYYKLGKSK
jgi:UDPglucose 6-dehydrogenase